MEIIDKYDTIKSLNIPIELIVNCSLIIEKIIDGYFISFKKFYRRHNQDLLNVIDNLTYYIIEIKIFKIENIGIFIFHIDNSINYDKVNFKNINNYLSHPKVYDNIEYGIKFSIWLNSYKVYKTAGFNKDITIFREKIEEIKKYIFTTCQKLKFDEINLKVEEQNWFSKNYLIKNLENNLNQGKIDYLIRLLHTSKFVKLSSIISNNPDLIQKHYPELKIIISFIKTHQIYKENININMWEEHVINNIIKTT